MHYSWLLTLNFSSFNNLTMVTSLCYLSLFTSGSCRIKAAHFSSELTGLSTCCDPVLWRKLKSLNINVQSNFSVWIMMIRICYYSALYFKSSFLSHWFCQCFTFSYPYWCFYFYLFCVLTALVWQCSHLTCFTTSSSVSCEALWTEGAAHKASPISFLVKPTKLHHENQSHVALQASDWLCTVQGSLSINMKNGAPPPMMLQCQRATNEAAPGLPQCIWPWPHCKSRHIIKWFMCYIKNWTEAALSSPEPEASCTLTRNIHWQIFLYLSPLAVLSWNNLLHCTTGLA